MEIVLIKSVLSSIVFFFRVPKELSPAARRCTLAMQARSPAPTVGFLMHGVFNHLFRKLLKALASGYYHRGAESLLRIYDSVIRFKITTNSTNPWNGRGRRVSAIRFKITTPARAHESASARTPQALAFFTE